jgi:hypothetical protein
MLFREIIAVYRYSYNKYLNTLCGHGEDFRKINTACSETLVPSHRTYDDTSQSISYLRQQYYYYYYYYYYYLYHHRVSSVKTLST